MRQPYGRQVTQILRNVTVVPAAAGFMHVGHGLDQGAILLGVPAYESAYDEPQRGAGRTVVAVLLALAVLAVLGGVFGYLLGNRAKDNGAAGNGGHSPGSGQSAPAGDPCPPFIQTAARAKGAKVPMTLRLYMRTAKSEVWICAGADKRLWYQGHSIRQGRFPDEVPVEGVNGLLLGGVNGIDQGRYVAVNQDANGTTTYTVSKDQLVIERNGKKSTEPAVNP
jgi:hypothetical protein